MQLQFEQFKSLPETDCFTYDDLDALESENDQIKVFLTYVR